MRVRQLWAPVLSTYLVSVSAQFVALRVAVATLGIFHAEWRIDRAGADVDAGAAIHRRPWSLALPARRREYPRPPAGRAGLSRVERKHPDAGGSAADGHPLATPIV